MGFRETIRWLETPTQRFERKRKKDTRPLKKMPGEETFSYLQPLPGLALTGDGDC